MLLQLTYISASQQRDMPTDGEEILHVARMNNARDNITGILAFTDGQYFQVLEGPEEPVERCFERIRKDQRHSNVTPLLRTEASERLFPDWSMAWHHCPADHPLSAMVRTFDISGIDSRRLRSLAETLVGHG